MLKVISLYTGMGGLDFGFEAAGFRTAVAVELDETCCSNLRANRNWPVIQADISQVRSKEILKAAQLRRGEADVLIGGPPCQPFSKSSYWHKGDSKRLKDPRAKTLKEYLRILRDTLPRTFLLENVPGLAFQGKDEGLRLLLRGIQKINSQTRARYSVKWAVLHAAQFGVPQLRSRLFLVGSRDGNEFTFPAPTHAAPDECIDSGLEPFRTCWDSIGDLQSKSIPADCDMGGRWADLLPSIPEGNNYLWHTPRGGGLPLFGWRTRFWSFLLKLAKAQPSWTLVSNVGPASGPFHWDNRRLTIQELARLQTLPDGLKFLGSYRESRKMIGNAVPSLLAEIIAREMRRQLLASPQRASELKLMPPKRRKRPVPEQVEKAPRKYFSLRGDHPDHPGEGMGPGRMRVRDTPRMGTRSLES